MYVHTSSQVHNHSNSIEKLSKYFHCGQPLVAEPADCHLQHHIQQRTAGGATVLALSEVLGRLGVRGEARPTRSPHFSPLI